MPELDASKLVKMNRGLEGARTGTARPSSSCASAIAVALLLLVTACAKPEERAEKYYQNAVRLIAEKKDLDARLELLNAVKYRSDHVDTWRALAGVNERTGEKALLFSNLRRIAELSPGDIDNKVKLARMMVDGGANEAAMKLIETTDGTQRADVLALKARALVALKDPDGAIREAKKAYELDPTNADAGLLLASERIARNDFQQALNMLDKVAVAPGDNRIPAAKVQIFERMGKLGEAEQELRKLSDKNPSDLGFRTHLAQLYAKERKFDEAEKELRTISELSPGNSKPAMDLIRFIATTRGLAAARQELDARIGKGGEVFPFQMALADIEAGQRNFAEAARLLEKLVSDTSSATDKNIARVKLAELNAAQKDTAGAEKLIGDVLGGDRRNVGALRLRAAIRLDRGDTDSAIADLREALNEQPKAPEILILLAQAYERSGQSELADRQFSEAARFSELNPAVVLRYVAFLRRTGNLARAEDILTDAGRRNPQSVEIFSSLAQVRLTRKNWSGAIEIANAMARNERTNSLGEQIRAAALSGQDKPEESIAALERAHAAAPNALPPVGALVRAYSAQKNFAKAETLLKEMLQKLPSNSQLLVTLGQLQQAKGAPQDAQKSFEAAIVQQPKDGLGYSALAEQYVRDKKLDEANSVVDRGLKEIPDDVRLRLIKSNVLGARGQYDEAISVLDGIVKDQPGSLIAVNNLASMLLDYRTDKESLDRALVLVEALRVVDLPQFLDTIGWAAHRRGDPSAAVPLLERAKSQIPEFAAVRFHLALAYRALGQEQKATEELKAALLLEPEESALKKQIRSALN